MAQTLKFGNKTWATKVGSTLAYNDENANYKPLPFAFTRSTSATRVNKEGLIEVVTSDRPRIDYTDTSDGVLLLEKAATNLITYSKDFSNAYWTKTNVSVVAGFSAPDGSLNAYKLVEGTSNSIHFINRVLTVENAKEYTESIFVKSAERTKFGIRDGFSNKWITINLSNGSVIDSNGLIMSKITKLANDWYRISYTFLTLGTSVTLKAYPLSDSYTGGSPETYTYQGDGTSGVYIYGAQLELGNVSSYIPTQGSATTRVAETATGSGNSEVFNDSEGVLMLQTNPSENGYISLTDGSSNNRIFLGFDNLSAYTQIRVGGAVKADMITTAYLKNTTFKILVKYKTNDFALWVNGFEIKSDNNGSTFPSGVLNNLSFNVGAGSEPFYGKTKELGYYDTILTDLELETLTSYKSWTSMVNELNLNIIYNG